MKIIGLGKPIASGNQVLICQLSEVELDKITGSAGKTHAPHRYKAGAVINLNKIYNRIKYFNENFDAIQAAVDVIRAGADGIDNATPIEEPQK